MIDSLERQALSCTFVVRNGAVQSPGGEYELGQGALSLTAGAIIDSKYRVGELLGQGGMGAVYRVRHLLLKKEMALKTFRSKAISPEVWTRFQREAQAIGRLKHKNIVEVFDFGIAQGSVPYYTMELLVGVGLNQRLAEKGGIEPVQALNIFLQAAEAMAHAHRQQIIHRDVKPANIFLQEPLRQGGEPLVKIVDFGIAKLAEESSAQGEQFATRSGTIFGTPLYMSPEQSLALPVDKRSDIYSFGCALYECLVGKPPFVGETALQTLMEHQTKAPPRLREVLVGGDLPQRLDNLISRLLAKAPEKRYQTFEAVAADLRFCIEELLVSGRRPPQQTVSSGPIGPEQEESQGEIAGTGRALPAFPQIAIGLGLVASLSTVAIYSIFSSSNHHASDLARASKSVVKLPEISATEHLSGDDQFAAARQKEHMIRTPFLRQPVGHYRIFDFPTYASIGDLQERNEAQKDRCIGTVKVLDDCGLTFRANIEVMLDPSLLDRFGPNDLGTLHFNHDDQMVSDWTNEHLMHVPRLSGLAGLNLTACHTIDGSAIQYISKLPRLDFLSVSDSGIDGRSLTRLTTLPQLASLTVNQTKNLGALFAFMAKHPDNYKLNRLIAIDSHITDNDLKYLGQLKGLDIMLLANNDITGSGLHYLTAMPHLQILAFDGCKVSPGSLAVLKDLKSLTVLQVSKGAFSKDEFQWLRKQLGHIRLHEIADQFEKRF